LTARKTNKRLLITLFPRTGSNWLKTSSENPSPLIVTAPPPYPILLGLRSVTIAEPKLCPVNKDMKFGLKDN
jgi:hypothetical protein